MIRRTLQLDIDDVEEGMILAESVLDAQGGLLVASGTELTSAHLKSLGRRGIDSLAVLNNRISEAELAAERQLQQERLAKLFRKYTGGTDSKLLQYVTQYRIGE